MDLLNRELVDRPVGRVGLQRGRGAGCGAGPSKHGSSVGDAKEGAIMSGAGGSSRQRHFREKEEGVGAEGQVKVF